MIKMPALRILPVVLLAATVSCQTFETDMGQDTSRSSVAASLMNITFSDQSAANCGQSEDNALSIAIRTVPAKDTCFNLEQTFTNPQTRYSTNGYSCEGGDICGVNYTVTSDASAFNTNANYSQVFYTQVRNPFTPRQQNNSTTNDDDGDDSADLGSQLQRGGRLVFETYNAANCKQERKSDDKLPFYKWDCNAEAGVCDTVPFSVKSFTISMNDPEHVADNHCVVAAEGGVGETVQVNGFAALAAAFLGLAFLV